MNNAVILVDEDDEGIQDMLSYSLEPEGFKLHSAYTVKESWEIIENKQIDLVLLDWMLPDRSGIDLLHRIRKYYSQIHYLLHHQHRPHIRNTHNDQYPLHHHLQIYFQNDHHPYSTP